jgi:hypothetical protein
VREWTHTLPMKFWIFKEVFYGSKLIELKKKLYHWKAFETYMFKISSDDPFEYSKHKLWLKKRLVIKLPFWLPIVKSQKSPLYTRVQVVCHMSLEKSRWQLQFCLRAHFNCKSTQKVITPKVLGLPIWESWDKMTFGCSPCGSS